MSRQNDALSLDTLATALHELEQLSWTKRSLSFNAADASKSGLVAMRNDAAATLAQQRPCSGTPFCSPDVSSRYSASHRRSCEPPTSTTTPVTTPVSTASSSMLPGALLDHPTYPLSSMMAGASFSASQSQTQQPLVIQRRSTLSNSVPGSLDQVNDTETVDSGLGNDSSFLLGFPSSYYSHGHHYHRSPESFATSTNSSNNCSMTGRSQPYTGTTAGLAPLSQQTAPSTAFTAQLSSTAGLQFSLPNQAISIGSTSFGVHPSPQLFNAGLVMNNSAFPPPLPTSSTTIRSNNRLVMRQTRRPRACSSIVAPSCGPASRRHLFYGRHHMAARQRPYELAGSPNSNNPVLGLLQHQPISKCSSSSSSALGTSSRRIHTTSGSGPYFRHSCSMSSQSRGSITPSSSPTRSSEAESLTPLTVLCRSRSLDDVHAAVNSGDPGYASTTNRSSEVGDCPTATTTVPSMGGSETLLEWPDVAMDGASAAPTASWFSPSYSTPTTTTPMFPPQ